MKELSHEMKKLVYDNLSNMIENSFTFDKDFPSDLKQEYKIKIFGEIINICYRWLIESSDNKG